MIKILFVCHGNICRSPMAEFVMRDMVEKRGLSDRITIASCATSDEETGSGMHSGTRRKLAEHGISCDGKVARRITLDDVHDYDYIVTMEEYNNVNILRHLRYLGITRDEVEILRGKMSRLLDFTDRPRDIADPWYTGNFDITYDEIVEGSHALLERIIALKTW